MHNTPPGHPGGSPSMLSGQSAHFTSRSSEPLGAIADQDPFSGQNDIEGSQAAQSNQIDNTSEEVQNDEDVQKENDLDDIERGDADKENEDPENRDSDEDDDNDEHDEGWLPDEVTEDYDPCWEAKNLWHNYVLDLIRRVFDENYVKVNPKQDAAFLRRQIVALAEDHAAAESVYGEQLARDDMNMDRIELANAERNEAVAERNQLIVERDELIASRNTLFMENNHIMTQRDQIERARIALVEENARLSAMVNGSRSVGNPPLSGIPGSSGQFPSGSIVAGIHNRIQALVRTIKGTDVAHQDGPSQGGLDADLAVLQNEIHRARWNREVLRQEVLDLERDGQAALDALYQRLLDTDRIANGGVPTPIRADLRTVSNLNKQFAWVLQKLETRLLKCGTDVQWARNCHLAAQEHLQQVIGQLQDCEARNGMGQQHLGVQNGGPVNAAMRSEVVGNQVPNNHTIRPISQPPSQFELSSSGQIPVQAPQDQPFDVAHPNHLKVPQHARSITRSPSFEDPYLGYEDLYDASPPPEDVDPQNILILESDAETSESADSSENVAQEESPSSSSSSSSNSDGCSRQIRAEMQPVLPSPSLALPSSSPAPATTSGSGSSSRYPSRRTRNENPDYDGSRSGAMTGSGIPAGQAAAAVDDGASNDGRDLVSARGRGAGRGRARGSGRGRGRGRVSGRGRGGASRVPASKKRKLDDDSDDVAGQQSDGEGPSKEMAKGKSNAGASTAKKRKTSDLAEKDSENDEQAMPEGTGNGAAQKAKAVAKGKGKRKRDADEDEDDIEEPSAEESLAEEDSSKTAKKGKAAPKKPISRPRKKAKK